MSTEMYLACELVLINVHSGLESAPSFGVELKAVQDFSTYIFFGRQYHAGFIRERTWECILGNCELRSTDSGTGVALLFHWVMFFRRRSLALSLGPADPCE